MTRFKHLLTAAALFAAAAVRVWGQPAWTRIASPAAMADTARAKGVSAAYCGMAGGRVVLAGGCNFPARPAADGGAKRFAFAQRFGHIPRFHSPHAITKTDKPASSLHTTPPASTASYTSPAPPH